MKRRTKDVELLLERAAGVFEQEITSVANQVRTELVIPFCDRYGVSFASGNGTWVFIKNGQVIASSPVEHLNEVKGPRGFTFVARVLDLTIPVWDRGMPAYMGGLGAFVDDYTPAKES